MKNILKEIAGLFLGRKVLQKPFEILYKISIKGMNFGLSETSSSGEKYVLKLIQRSTKGNFPTIFDVGANKGQFAKLTDEVFSGSGKIYSFEPGEFTYSELLRNTSYIKNIETYNFGFGSRSAEMYLNYDNKGSGLASVYERNLDHMGIDFDKKEKIEIKKIDDFCEKNNIKNIDLLKIDVEGHEIEVLKGAEKMIAENKIKAIQFEFGGCNIDSRTYFHDFYLLLKDKYSIYRILQDGLCEIKQYSELQEIFTTINYYAKLKEKNDYH